MMASPEEACYGWFVSVPCAGCTELPFIGLPWSPSCRHGVRSSARMPYFRCHANVTARGAKVDTKSFDVILVLIYVNLKVE